LAPRKLLVKYCSNEHNHILPKLSPQIKCILRIITQPLRSRTVVKNDMVAFSK